MLTTCALLVIFVTAKGVFGAPKKSDAEMTKFLLSISDHCVTFTNKERWLSYVDQTDADSRHNCFVTQFFMHDKQQTYRDFIRVSKLTATAIDQESEEQSNARIQAEAKKLEPFVDAWTKKKPAGTTNEKKSEAAKKWAKAITATMNQETKPAVPPPADEIKDEETEEKLNAESTKTLPNAEAVKKEFPAVYEETTRDGPTDASTPNPYADTFWTKPGISLLNVAYNYRKRKIRKRTLKALTNCYTKRMQDVFYQLQTEVFGEKMNHQLDQERVRRAIGVANTSPAPKTAPLSGNADDEDEAVMTFYCAVGVMGRQLGDYSFETMLQHWFMERFYNYAVNGEAKDLNGKPAVDDKGKPLKEHDADKMDYPWYKYKSDNPKLVHPSAVRGLDKLHKLLDKRIRKIAK